VDASVSMSWTDYSAAFLAFNLLGCLACYALLRAQAWLPWNPQGFPSVPPHTAFNIAVSFATNTNSLLRRHLLIYGAGGVLLPFARHQGD